MERVAPRQVNYDNILPLAIESRSNRREFLPVNGQQFSNSSGATICRIDVNADSMLDATHSYLECKVKNQSGTPNSNLSINPFTPAWIQRLRIESGGVVIEDINEYSRLYAMLVLQQCPQNYVMNNLSNQGLYKHISSANLAAPANADVYLPTNGGASGLVRDTSAGGTNAENITQPITEIMYSMSCQALMKGVRTDMDYGICASSAFNQPTAEGLLIQQQTRLAVNASQTMCFPLVSGFLNMDKYIPLIMMNAGFTIELTLCDANRIGITQTETAGADAGAFIANLWEVNNVRYVAHLIDLDRSFYDRLRSVMEGSGGVLQLAGQTYRHFVGEMPNNVGPHTITLPARVKSVKSIFGTFIDTTQMGNILNYDTSVFQHAGLDTYRFEIGSVRYPQTDVQAGTAQNEVELQKAWGRLGDYAHQQAYTNKHTQNGEEERDGSTYGKALLSAYAIGYDFEAFQRVALEAGINTADRSLPINFIATRSGATTNATRCDFFILVDAIYYINLDGTVSVSI